MVTNKFTMPVAKPKKLGPEFNFWYWNPNRVGASQAPSWFMKKLKEVGEELDCRWNPVKERWLIWMRAPRVNHPICQGWKLLFVHQNVDGSYLPLDERVFARLYAASVFEHGSARAYFDRIKAEYERDKERADKKHTQDTIDAAMPSFHHSQISVAGFGKSNGSKFSRYHA